MHRRIQRRKRRRFKSAHDSTDNFAYEPTNKRERRRINQLAKAPTSQQTDERADESTNYPHKAQTNQSTNQPINQSTNQPINQSTNQPTTD
jgi:hypothetical protein